MIYNIKEFEKKLIDKDLNRKVLAARIGINPNTLSAKLEKKESDFKISEAVAIAKELDLNPYEFMLLFFNIKLSSYESFNEQAAAKDVV